MIDLLAGYYLFISILLCCFGLTVHGVRSLNAACFDLFDSCASFFLFLLRPVLFPIAVALHSTYIHHTF